MKSEDFEAKLSVWIAPADKDKTGSLGSRGSSQDSARGRHGPASGKNSDEGSGHKGGYLTFHTSANQDLRHDTNPNLKTKETTSKYSKHSYSSDEEEEFQDRKNSRERTTNKMQETWGQKRDSNNHMGYRDSQNKKSVEKEGASTKPNESLHSSQIDESWNRGRSAEPTANSTQQESASNIKTKGSLQENELRFQVRKMQAESVDQQETIQRLEDENYELRSELFEFKDALANMEIEVANLRSQGPRNATKPTNNTENSYGDDREMSLYTSEIGDLKKTLASKNALLKLQTEEMTSMGKRVEMLSQEVAKLNVMLSQSEEDKQKILEETAQVAKNEIDMLRGHLEDLQGGLEAAVKRAEKSEQGWNASETKLRMVRDEYERFKAESKNLADRLDEQHQQTLISLRKELEDSRRQVERREADAIKRERDSAARDRERDLQNLQSRLELEIKERDREIEVLKAEVQAGRERIEQEVQKLHSLSSQQVELLRAENKELDRRVMDEIRKRHSSEERLRAKERAERDTGLLSRGDHLSSGTPNRPKSSSRKQSGLIRSGNHPDQPEQSSGSPANNLVSELEKQLSSKTHEVIDLTSVNNSLSRRLAAAEHDQQQATRRATLLDQELGFLKEKHAALADKMKYLQTAESIQQKTEFEVLKELNDLREAVQKLKEERDKILRVLGTDTFHLDLISEIQIILLEASIPQNYSLKCPLKYS